MQIDHKIKNDKKVLHWHDFSNYVHIEDNIVIPHIAAFFRTLLEKYEESEFTKYLILPSPIALSGFFKCTELEIMGALQELQRQGYNYEISGVAGPITIWDPLIQHRETEESEPLFHWQQWFQQLLANPLNLSNQP